MKYFEAPIITTQMSTVEVFVAHINVGALIA